MDSDLLVKQIESVRGRPLTEDEASEIELWRKGRALAHLVNTEGWTVILEMLKSYVESGTLNLLKSNPGNKDLVLAEHAHAWAANRIYNCFIQDVQAAIDSTAKTPDVLKRTIQGIPPESL